VNAIGGGTHHPKNVNPTRAYLLSMRGQSKSLCESRIARKYYITTLKLASARIPFTTWSTLSSSCIVQCYYYSEHAAFMQPYPTVLSGTIVLVQQCCDDDIAVHFDSCIRLLHNPFRSRLDALTGKNTPWSKAKARSRKDYLARTPRNMIGRRNTPSTQQDFHLHALLSVKHRFSTRAAFFLG
jgi:hypothetical protein